MKDSSIGQEHPSIGSLSQWPQEQGLGWGGCRGPGAQSGFLTGWQELNHLCLDCCLPDWEAREFAPMHSSIHICLICRLWCSFAWVLPPHVLKWLSAYRLLLTLGRQVQKLRKTSYSFWRIFQSSFFYVYKNKRAVDLMLFLFNFYSVTLLHYIKITTCVRFKRFF